MLTLNLQSKQFFYLNDYFSNALLHKSIILIGYNILIEVTVKNLFFIKTSGVLYKLVMVNEVLSGVMTVTFLYY